MSQLKDLSVNTLVLATARSDVLLARKTKPKLVDVLNDVAWDLNWPGTDFAVESLQRVDDLASLFRFASQAQIDLTVPRALVKFDVASGPAAGCHIYVVKIAFLITHLQNDHRYYIYSCDDGETAVPVKDVQPWELLPVDKKLYDLPQLPTGKT